MVYIPNDPDGGLILTSPPTPFGVEVVIHLICDIERRGGCGGDNKEPDYMACHCQPRDTHPSTPPPLLEHCLASCMAKGGWLYLELTLNRFYDHPKFLHPVPMAMLHFHLPIHSIYLSPYSVYTHF